MLRHLFSLRSKTASLFNNLPGQRARLTCNPRYLKSKYKAFVCLTDDWKQSTTACCLSEYRIIVNVKIKINNCLPDITFKSLKYIIFTCHKAYLYSISARWQCLACSQPSWCASFSFFRSFRTSHIYGFHESVMKTLWISFRKGN